MRLNFFLCKSIHYLQDNSQSKELTNLFYKDIIINLLMTLPSGIFYLSLQQNISHAESRMSYNKTIGCHDTDCGRYCYHVPI
jgi:hypothetical protein